MQRHGAWRGPYEEGTLFFYIDEYIKDAPKDLLAVLGATADWLARSLKKESTLVEKNIDALAGLLQLNPAERALLLYGTLARYQRDLRGLLVEFKVSNAQEAYAAIAAVAGVNERDVAEALRAGSRLERIGMVENLISEHNITDLADLMKVSEQLPPVLMREYQGPSDLMAVFTRPATRSELTPADFDFVGDDLEVLTALLGNAVRARRRRQRAAVRPARHRQDRAGEGGGAGRGARAVRGRVRRPRRQFADRPRPLPLAADQPGVPEGQRQRRAAVRRGRGRVPADLDRRRAADGAARHRRRLAAGGSVSGKAWVNQILETNPVPVIWVTNRIEQIDPAFRRRFQYHLELKSPPPGAREALVARALAGVEVSAGFAARLADGAG